MDLGFTAGRQIVFQLYVDDYTRESFIDILDKKSDALPRWKELKGKLENENQPWKFAFIKTDSEPNYMSKEWAKHCTANDLTHEFSSPYKHGQLGVIDRTMQSIGVPFRCGQFR